MKRHVKVVITGIVLVTIMGFGYTFVAPNHANACGWGRAGGEDYVPQRRDSTGPIAQRPLVTKEQAYDIVTNHVKRLNPTLEVGPINDAGGFYEVDILTDKKKVVQRLGVDKRSGRLMLIN
ncbi:MAG: hypothetical protein JSW04_06420 [Desulfobacterales bacterium]|nr:MAG: hypothetical protein JSW04_06420 [Desulfobacterales bacterium]